jgi:exopolyphosphatase/guanosine-5'-triphosphate,3'-diphosphate pyrophosphatase
MPLLRVQRPNKTFSAHFANGDPRLARPIGIVAVDAGSNAIRAMVARAESATEVTPIASERWPVRLGHNVFTHRRLTPSTIARATETFRHFRSLLKQHDIHLYRAVATAAVREAENRDSLLKKIHRDTGIRLEAIDAGEEARLTRLAVHTTLGDTKPRLIADLGGGSLEISLLRERRVERALALPVGTVRLMESMGLANVVNEDKFNRLQHYLLSLLRSTWPDPPSLSGEIAVLSGGNAETLARLCPGPRYRGIPSINLRLLRDRVWEILRRDIRARMRVFGFRRDRAEVVGIAAVVFLCLAAHTEMETALVPGVGVREGVLFDLAAEHFRSPGADKHRTEALIENARIFAARMHCDLKHAEHVRHLAGSLFDQLSRVHSQPPEMRLPLEMAALMHDSGANVNEDAHHKHGEYMVRNAALGGISEQLQTIVACLVRYHGKSEPEPHHKLYASLDSRQRRLVRELASILKIAAGLDASGIQGVQDVRARIRGVEICLTLSVVDGVSLDVTLLRRKARMFEREFGVTVVFGRMRRAAKPKTPQRAGVVRSIRAWKSKRSSNIWTLTA